MLSNNTAADVDCCTLCNVRYTFPPQILKAPCLLLSLVTSLNLCSGKFGSPITDDVNKLPVLVSYYKTDTYHIYSALTHELLFCASC